MTPADDTRVFAGIDEAGLGPLLGPLTLGWSAFRVPRGRCELWRRLGTVVGREPHEDREKIVVADSKRVFTRNPRGHARLETTALAFLAAADAFGAWPARAGDLWALAPRSIAQEAHGPAPPPWFPRDVPLPRHVAADRLALRAHRLRRTLERTRITVVDAGVRALHAGELNESFRRTENKAATQWAVVSAIVRHLWTRHAADGLSLFVDRLGGRRHYVPLLAALFPAARIETLRERDDLGEYVVREDARRMRVVFAERGEERSFSVALASCLAKYGRELVMDAFNDYFTDLQPGLRPTAGYTTDGRRWLEEARPALALCGVPSSSIVRER